jgi:cephalosporin hydroxylase
MNLYEKFEQEYTDKILLLGNDKNIAKVTNQYEFKNDKEINHKLLITVSHDGYLKRVTE